MALRLMLVLISFVVLSCLSAASTATVARAEEIAINRLEFSPSGILTEDDLMAIRAAYEGKRVHVEELLALIDAIDLLYVEKGFVAKAILPEQTIEDGVVTIHLVEARYGRIILEGNQSTQDAFITARLDIQSGELIDIVHLDQSITYFNRTNDAKLHAQLSPGEAFGTSDVIVLVQEPKREQFLIALSGGGRAQDAITRTFTWQIHSLRGMRDAVTATVVDAPGTASGSLSYNVPINSKGTRFGLTMSVSTVEILDEDGTGTGIKRESNQKSATLSHPFKVNPTSTTLISAEWQSRETNMFIEDVPLSGATNQSVTLGHTVEGQMSGGMWSFSHGVRAGVSQVQGGQPTRYHKYNVSAQRSWHTPSGTVWTVRGVVQHPIGGGVPDGEDFSLGGPTTVRGIYEGAVRADGGYSASIEHRRSAIQGAEVFGFLDHGGVGAYGLPGLLPGQTTRTSFGIGAEWRPLDYVSVGVVFAWPLGHVDDMEKHPFYARVNIAF